MSQNNAPETYRELLRLLIEFLDDSEDETAEEADAYVRDSGYDPDLLVQKTQLRIRAALDNSPLNWRNQSEKIKQERRTLTSMTGALSGNIDQIKAEINALLQSSQARLALHHRNLNVDDMSEDDLIQLRAELEFQLSKRPPGSDKDEDT